MFKFQAVKNIDYIINYYSILEIPESATIAEINKQFKSLAQQYHPDKFQKSGKEIQELSARKMSLLLEAHSVLKTEESKAVYDAALNKFKQTKPKLISTDGTAILDLSGESVSLDFLLSGALKFDFQDAQNEKANQLIGYNEIVLEAMEKAHLANPEDEALKAAYIDQLNRKKIYLDWQEKSAWQEMGVLNAKEVKIQQAMDYLPEIENKISQIKNELNSLAEVRLLGVDSQPLLIGTNQPILSPSEENLALVKSELSQTFDQRKEKLLAIAQEKQEFLNKIVKVRTVKNLSTNSDSKNFQVLLHDKDNKILVAFIISSSGENNMEVGIIPEYDGKYFTTLSDFKYTTYALLINPELDLVFQVMELVNEIANS